MRSFISFSSGLIFAIGLVISGMTQPHIVRGFLDFFGTWDPRLLGVMVGAIAVHATAFRIIRKRNSPLLESAFQLPTKKDIDARLILGAAVFGIGWGWAGICPGPGLVGLVSGDLRFMLFIGALLVGMKAFQIVDHKLVR